MAENLNVELDLKDISEDESARAELLEKGGKQQVPYLVDTENDVAMYESSDIIDYIRENGVKGEKTAEQSHVSMLVVLRVCLAKGNYLR